MISVLGDIRFALRALRKRPPHATLVILVLALAIGACTAVFSVFNGFFMRPLPYPDDDRLVMIHNSYSKSGLEIAASSIPDYLDRLDHAPSLESLAIFRSTQRVLGDAGDVERISVPLVSPSLFNVLGIMPALGTVFTDADLASGGDRIAVISHQLWTTRFGQRPDIIGNDIRLDGDPYTIVAVMPPRFAFPNGDARAWVPFTFTPAQSSDAERANECCGLIGRLHPGATIATLDTELGAIIHRNSERLPEHAERWKAAGFNAHARTLRDALVGDLRPMVRLLQSLVFAILVIACVNVANLQVARTVARQKELVMRVVLGAPGGRLASIVVTECAVLAAAGAVVGLAIAAGGLEFVRGLGLDRSIDGFQFAMDGTVLAVTLGATVFAVLVSALMPLLMLRKSNIALSIAERDRMGGGKAARRASGVLVMIQISLSVALLVSAGLLAKSFYLLQQEGPGFDATQVLTARVALPLNRYGAAGDRVHFYRSALEELRAVPGVAVAGFTSDLPFTDSDSQGTVTIDGYVVPVDTSPPHAMVRSINESYFASLGIPVIQGRNFVADEPERVVIIDENMARRYWPDGDAIGQRIRRPYQSEDMWFTVVGVVPPVKHGSLTERATKETIYWHYQQRADVVGVFTLRTTLPPAQLQRAINEAVRRVDAELPLFDVRPLESRLSASLAPQRTPMVLTLLFAAIAVTLSIVGVYGVLTWAVTLRTGELGLRMALGARAVDVTRLIVGQGGRLVVVGIVAGMFFAVALGRTMSAQLHHVNPFDLQIYASVITGLAALALLTCWLPARRAGRLNPVDALRGE